MLLAAVLWVPAGAAPVPYQAVLEAPDDAALNLRYARERAEAGEFLAALAALERVLAVAPNHPESRLLYAAVLGRLGRPEEAGRELAELERPGMPPAVREAAGRLRGRLAGPRRLSLEGALGAGGEWSSNANYAPRTGQALLFGAPVDLAPESRRREDAALTSFARLGGRLALGKRRRAGAVWDSSYYRVDRRGLSARDLQGVSARAGLAWRGLTIQGSFDHLSVDRDTFLRSPGGVIRLEGRLTPKAGVWMEGKGAYEDFARPSIAPASPERRGPRWEAGAGLSLGGGPGWRLQAGLRHAEKYAANRVHAYLRDGVDGALSWESATGAFARVSAGVDWDRYAKADLVVSSRRRVDILGRYGAALGTPLGFLHPWMNSLSVSALLERVEASSSLLNYRYTENRVSLMAAWRWRLL
ncbi:MAG: hypothetical protein CO113_10030 [Elusimicrobia bacterium CG_4_9_14_3_um_filter_62_55]|nr:MAG: hypothetical protein CO113_10030 [Elusimicrobia bacterium CG_4_9_14_3_um_filter_62_55]